MHDLHEISGGSQTTSESSHVVIRIDPTEDIRSQLMSAFKSSDTQFNDSIDRCGLRSLLSSFRVSPASESADLVELMFHAMGVAIDGRCCIHKLIDALNPYLCSSARSSKLLGEVVHNAIHAFLESAKAGSSRVAPADGPCPPQKDAPPSTCCDSLPDAADLESGQRKPPASRRSGPRCAAAVCLALVLAAAVTFGICLAVAKLGHGGGP